MAAKLNHTIVWCHDQEKSGDFLGRDPGPAAAAQVHGLSRRRPRERSLGRLFAGRVGTDRVATSGISRRARTSSTARSRAFASARPRSGPTLPNNSRAASTITSAAAASTSTIPTGTCSRSSPRPTAIRLVSSPYLLDAHILLRRAARETISLSLPGDERASPRFQSALAIMLGVALLRHVDGQRIRC